MFINKADAVDVCCNNKNNKNNDNSSVAFWPLLTHMICNLKLDLRAAINIFEHNYIITIICHDNW